MHLVLPVIILGVGQYFVNFDDTDYLIGVVGGLALAEMLRHPSHRIGLATEVQIWRALLFDAIIWSGFFLCFAFGVKVVG